MYPDRQNVDVAAKNIVSDVLEGHGYFIRRGHSSTLSWFLNTFMPYGLCISMINEKSGLSELARGSK